MALSNKTQGIILLIVAALIWAPIPGFGIVNWHSLAALAILVLGIYNLLR